MIGVAHLEAKAQDVRQCVEPNALERGLLGAAPLAVVGVVALEDLWYEEGR